MLFPPLDQARRNGLCSDMHQSPLGKFILRDIDLAAVDRVEDVLCPRHQKPYDRRLLTGNRLKDPLGLHAAQQHGLAAYEKASEPVHLRAGVIQRRDAEEHIVVRLSMMVLLGQAGRHKRAVRVQDRLGESRRTR